MPFHMLRGHPRFLIMLLVGALLSAAAALVLPPPHAELAGGAAPATDRAFQPRNILIITVDTTRADHLSCYGYAYRTTPNIDALAREGVRFERASAIVPLTGPGHATLMTGLVPRDHGAIRNGVRIRETVSTLAETLSALGFRTAAFISGWTLRAQLTGLDRGFDTYDDDMTDRYHLVNSQRRGDETTDRALAWLQSNAGSPFFLWVHLFDPHDPYRRHGLDLPLVPGATATRRGSKIAAYDQEIAFADHQVGRLMAALESAGARQDTLFVLTSDHGEAFGEHGESGHGRHLYETTQHIPLILVHPAMGRGVVTDLLASTQDIYPTILGMLGVPVSPGLEGIRLDEAIQAPAAYASREIYMETFHGARKKFWHIFGPSLTGDPILVAMRRSDWKAVLEPRTGKARLYDLSRDPRELSNLSDDQSYRLRHFLPRLAAYAGKEWQPAARPLAMTDEDRKKLEALGYTN